MRRFSTLLTGAALAGGISLLGAPAAFAKEPVACDAYAQTCPPVRGETTPSVSGTKGGVSVVTTTRTSTPSTLPFTGGDVVLISVLGAAAVAGGAALVVAGRRRGVATA
jgi:hypothetical protein